MIDQEKVEALRTTMIQVAFKLEREIEYINSIRGAAPDNMKDQLRFDMHQKIGLLDLVKKSLEATR